MSSISQFDGASGWVDQTFGLRGQLGPASVQGGIWFDPSAPAYLAAELTTALEVSRLSLSLTARHWTDDNYLWVEWYENGSSPCASDIEAGLQYIFAAHYDPITIQVRFADCCTGTWFQELVLSVDDMGLCCGITYDLEFWFTKAGFQYVAFSLEDAIEICCGISLDLEAKFGPDAKTLSVTPELAGLGKGCLEVYGDVDWEQNGALSIEAIRIDGWKIRCDLTSCAYAEFVTFLNPKNAELYGYEAVFNPSIGEFEYARLGFCGPGCCGGEYNVALTVFFHNDAYVYQPQNPLALKHPPYWRPPALPEPILPGPILPRPIIPFPILPIYPIRPPWWPLPPVGDWPEPPDTLFGMDRVSLAALVPITSNFNISFELSWGWYLVFNTIGMPPNVKYEYSWVQKTVLSLGWAFTF